MGNPDWKELYKGEWKKGANRVKYVIESVKKEFPHITIKKGFGANQSERIEGGPPKKHEPDLKLSFGGKRLLDIEVSGTGKKMEPTMDIWVLLGKFERALRRPTETWFFMVYEGSEFVLSMDLLKVFRKRVWVEEPKGVPEYYIHVPCKEAYQKDVLFNRIKFLVEGS